MRQWPWVAVFFLKALTTAADPEPICQLSGCSSLHSPAEEIHPQRYPLCSTKYYGIDMWPISPRQFQLTPRGSHIFDLFYEPSGVECTSVNVFLDVVDQQLDIFLTVSCGNLSVSTGLAYTARVLWTERCVHMYDMTPEFSKTCSYHQSEQIRFTIIDNETLLVEDLSLLMPPGTRIIFRAADGTGKLSQQDLSRCRCRNVHQDVWSYKQCGRYHQWLSDSLGEFLLCLGIVLGTVLIVFVGLWWATRVRDYQKIEVA